MHKYPEVLIDNIPVGLNHKPKFIAEIGVNHLGSFDRAIELVNAAHNNGADFLKLQTYKSEKRYDRNTNPKADLFIKNLSKWELSREQEKEVWEHAKSIGAKVFTSCFDVDSVEFAESLGCIAYKIAAFEVRNLELIRAVSSTKKPIIISRGMISIQDLSEVVNILEKKGCKYILLHTISSYPITLYQSNLRMIHKLKETFQCPVGHSDHTRGVKVPPLAVAAGSSIIEKHFTINKKLREYDHPFSVTPDELTEIKLLMNQSYQIMGSDNIEVTEAEKYMSDFIRIKK